MNLAAKSTLSNMLKAFKSDSEEEGELTNHQETDPKNFRADKMLTLDQFSKFLEYYTEKSGEYKYTKTQLNKINTIVHNHFNHLSKDVKAFKLYKAFIQLATQDMHEWIEKDRYCSDVVLEILREVQSRKEHPWYMKIFKKLRLEEIIKKHAEKAEVSRKVLEAQRVKDKRARNWEKRQKKEQVRVDPFDSVQLPSKLPVPLSVSEPEKCEEEFFKRPCFLDVFDEPEEIASEPIIEKSPVYEVEEWFYVMLDSKTVSAVNELFKDRKEPPKLDPRIEINLKCRGLDFVLDCSMLSNTLDKFIVVINVKCLFFTIDLRQMSKLKLQIPKDTEKIEFNGQDYLVCYRPHCKEFLNTLKKKAEILLFSLLPEGLAEQLLPGFKTISSKCVQLNEELLIVLDNDKIGWKPFCLVPVLLYDPFLMEDKIMLDANLCQLRDKDLVTFCNESGEGQLDGLGKIMCEVYASFIQNGLANTAIYEFRSGMKAIFEGLEFSSRFYEDRIGIRGFTKQKLEIYEVAIKELGGRVKEDGKYVVVESKVTENEVSGKWILACLMNFRFLDKF